jgi:tetratricopeptide (TPR) repeat protein
VVSIDVFAVTEAVARERLRSAVSSVVSGRAKPMTQPMFPTGRLDAENPGLLAGQFGALGAELGLPAMLDAEATVRVVCTELRRRGRWLLILDNAEEIDHIRPVLPGGSGHVLITTRRGGFRALGHALDLDVLARDEAIALLQHRAPQLSRTEADTLADRLGDLPLALAQAAAYLDQTQLPPADYLRLLHTHEATVLDRGQAIGHADTVHTLWSLSLERLQAEHPAAVQLLQLCAWLAPEPIPTDLFSEHPEHLPQPLAAAAADPLAFADTIAALTDYSLVRRTQHDLHLHRLVQTVTRQNQPENGPHPVPTILTLLHSDLPDDVYLPGSWPRWSQLLPHVLAATDHPQADAPNAAADTAWLLNHAADTIQLLDGDYTAALRLIKRTLRLREDLHGTDQPEAAVTLVRLADILLELGQAPVARPAAERAVRILQDTRGPDHPDTGIALMELGQVLIYLGEPLAAVPLLEHTLSIVESTGHTKERPVADSLVTLGLAHQGLGAPEPARSLLERALLARQEAYGAEHPWVCFVMIHLGNLLVAWGQPAVARPLLEHALRIHERTYGATSPAVAHALGTLGRALTELGEANTARPMLEHALRIKEAFYGPDNRFTANHMLWLGDAVRSLDGPAAARPLFERALRIRATAYGPDHPWTATAAIRLAAVLSDLGEHATAATYLDRAQQIHRSAYGNRRPGEPPC